MTLPFLPAELIFNIVDYLDPGSALAFALSTKTHLELCKDRLQQHAKLHAKYSIIRPNNEGHLIWDITKAIIQDPCKGWHVRELDLVTKRPDEYENMPEEDRSLFEAAVERMLPLYPYESGFFAYERSNTRELSDEMDDDLGRTANANTPKLTLDNTCIDPSSGPYKSTKYGRAVEPHVRFASSLPDDIWKGHSYFL